MNALAAIGGCLLFAVVIVALAVLAEIAGL
jgi:hypothetical protein